MNPDSKARQVLFLAAFLLVFPATVGAASATLDIDQVDMLSMPTFSLYVRTDGEVPAPGWDGGVARVSINGVPTGDAESRPFDAGRDPVATLLLLDTTRSLSAADRKAANEAAEGFIQPFIDRGSSLDRFAVYTFTDAVDRTVPFGTASPAVVASIDGIESRAGNTRIWDACIDSLKDLRAGKDSEGKNLPARRILLILSDGKDSGSSANRAQCYQDAANANIPVFTLGYGRAPALDDLRWLSDMTGGLHLRSEKTSGLNVLFDRVRERLADVRVVSLSACCVGNLQPDKMNTLGLELLSPGGEVLGRLGVEHSFYVPGTVAAGLEGPCRDVDCGGGPPPREVDTATDAATDDATDAAGADAGGPGDGGPSPQNKKAFFKQWWFWTAAGGGVVLVVLVLLLVLRKPKEVPCPQCGLPLPDGAAECPHCAERAAAREPAPAPAPAPLPVATPAAVAPEPVLLGELVVVAGGTKGQRLSLVDEVTIIGREPGSCQVVLDDDAVSRVHSTVRFFPDGVRVTDMGSSYGTKVNGRKVEANRWTPVQDGDEVQIGNLVFHFFDRRIS